MTIKHFIEHKYKAHDGAWFKTEIEAEQHNIFVHQVEAVVEELRLLAPLWLNESQRYHLSKMLVTNKNNLIKALNR